MKILLLVMLISDTLGEIGNRSFGSLSSHIILTNDTDF